MLSKFYFCIFGKSEKILSSFGRPLNNFYRLHSLLSAYQLDKYVVVYTV